MYSEVSDRDLVPPFLITVIDPKPYNKKGSGGKKDFLKGQSFLQDVDFPGCPALKVLIHDLAGLFQFHYAKKPTKEDREQYRGILSALKGSSYQDAYMKNNVCKQYDDGVSRLRDYAATIALFDTALSNRSKWPPKNNSPEKQDFKPKKKTGYVLKTGWGTTGVEGVHRN